MTTPIRADRLDYWLKGYDGEKRKFLVEGFKVGFRIPFAGQRSCRLSGNATSVSKNLDILKQKIQIEIDNHRVAGPFKVIPFQNFQSSPLGLVPKYSGETIVDYRVIHNLSFPEGTSVNDGIQEEFKSVQYQDIEDAVALMRKYGKNCGLFKLDIHNAYKNFPIHFSDSIKQSKTVLPCTSLTFFGIELDSAVMEKRLPQDKLRKVRHLIQTYKARKTVRLQELQSIIGLLNFACSVVIPGRPFLKRLCDLTIGLTRPYHHRHLNSEARADHHR